MPFAAEMEKKSSSHPAKWERNLRGRYVFTQSDPFQRLTTAHAELEELKSKKPKNQMNTTKTLIAGAAVAGLMAGSLPVPRLCGQHIHPGWVSLQTMAEEKGAHACKGQNACKGQGGCKSGDNGCKGKNSCKGKGGCATKGS